MARELGSDEAYCDLLPSDKMLRVGALLTQPKGKSIFVRDGINDTPVHTHANIGVAMGSDALIEVADVVLMDEQSSKVALSIRMAQSVMRIAW